MQVHNALLVELEAQPGKEQDLLRFLQQGAELAQQEAGTLSWFAVRFSANKFGIFDTFSDETGRQAHLAGQIAAALKEKAPELLSKEPQIMPLEVVAAKMFDEKRGITDDSGLGSPDRTHKGESL